jgi:selenide,water dikinase
VEWEGADEELKALLFDPQTAGGLLISVAAKDAASLTQALNEREVPAVDVGEVLPAGKPMIRVVL